MVNRSGAVRVNLQDPAVSPISPDGLQPRFSLSTGALSDLIAPFFDLDRRTTPLWKLCVRCVLIAVVEFFEQRRAGKCGNTDVKNQRAERVELRRFCCSVYRALGAAFE